MDADISSARKAKLDEVDEDRLLEYEQGGDMVDPMGVVE